MKKLFFVLFLACVQLVAMAQKISYDIPEGYESNISKKDYKTLVDLSMPVVSKRFVIESVKDGTMSLAAGQKLNLHNLILKCADETDKSEWKEVIENHFRSLFSSMDEEKKIKMEDYQSVKDYLSLRIYPNQYIRDFAQLESLVVRQDLEGTCTVLMLDLPGGFKTIQRSFFTLWKTDSAEVFRVAQNNINKQDIEKQTKTFDIDGSKIEISFLGNEDYAASYALDLLANSPALVGEWGSVIAMPNKGLVNVCRISKDKPLDFVKFIQATKPLIENSFKDHPQGISADYYWYYNRKFKRINVLTGANGQLNVISPMGLTELMTEKK